MGDAVNLAALLERDADTPALIVGERAVSYRQLRERAARWRGSLMAAGVRAGDRVAVAASNGEELVVAHLAAMGVGAISVPLNPQSPPAELARQLNLVDPFAAIADSTAEETLVASRVITKTLEMQRLSVDELDAGLPHELVEVEPSDPAVLLFTSGTAGPPKPAVLTHANLTAALRGVLSLAGDRVGRRHVVLGVLPLFHVFGLNIALHLTLLIGATLVLGDYVGPARTVDMIHHHRATVVAGPPALWRALVRAAQGQPERLASVELAVSGADRLPPRVRLDARRRLGLELREGYGLTETAAVVATTIGTTAPLGSVGRLLPGVEARLVDPDGDDCLVGDPGELWVRGEVVFPGYWGAAGGPGPLTPDGWLRTGDVAVVDEDGHLAIVGRLKDLIIVSGFNVHPGEVEGVLEDHRSVARAVVVGEPSEVTGEAVVAHVVPADGAGVDVDDLARHCRAQLARYKVPSRFVVGDEPPTGRAGKLLA